MLISELKLGQVFVYNFREDTKSYGLCLGEVVNTDKNTIVSDLYIFNVSEEKALEIAEIDFIATPHDNVMQLMSDENAKILKSFHTEGEFNSPQIKEFYLKTNPEYFI